MIRVAVLFCLMAACLASGTLPRVSLPRLDGRIVGGSPASISNYPHQLSLQSDGSHICGASIISVIWAVTGAHCVSGAPVSSISLRAGMSYRGSGGTVHAASRVIVHSGYNVITFDYDIAVIRVSLPFSFDSNVKSIALANHGENVATGTSATVTGWGTTAEGGTTVPTDLQQVSVPVLSDASCRSIYGSSSITFTDRMLCAGYTAGGSGPCQGDSGGPLIADGKLIGVVSWGNGCARPNNPNVYTRISALRTWISANTDV